MYERARTCMCAYGNLKSISDFIETGSLTCSRAYWLSQAGLGSKPQGSSWLHLPSFENAGMCRLPCMAFPCARKGLNSDLHPCLATTLPTYPEIATRDLPFAVFLRVCILLVTCRVKEDWQLAPASAICLFYFLGPRALVRAVPVAVMSEPLIEIEKSGSAAYFVGRWLIHF